MVTIELRLFGGGFDNFATLVLSAVRADAVRNLRFVAVRTLGEGRFGE